MISILKIYDIHFESQKKQPQPNQLAMKLSFLIFTIVVFYTRVALSLVHGGGTGYGIRLAEECTAETPECCRHDSQCALSYSASGEWKTVQDRKATRFACKFACLGHFKKCVDLCKCATRVTEAGASEMCKCKLSKPVIVKKSCIKHCFEARHPCVTKCSTKTCPLQAVTNMRWGEEFDGRCDALCKPKHALKKVCAING